ncbi:MAG: hypothetical protein ACREBE_11480 [bacterium]
MPIATTDLVFFSVASVPVDDTSTSGGAIDTASRVALTQFGANAVLALVSDGADARNVTIIGRLASGVVDTEVVALNATTEVLSTKTWERIHSIVLASSSGTRTVTAKQGSGGSTVATIVPNETTRHIQFQRSTSEASQAKRYEAQFGKNIHGSLSLLNAQMKLTADPQSKIQIGVAAAVNGSTSVTNRKTSPGVTLVDDNIAQNVPGTNLAAGDAIKVWIEQTLGANDAAQKSTFTLELSGSTT